MRGIVKILCEAERGFFEKAPESLLLDEDKNKAGVPLHISYYFFVTKTDFLRIHY